MLLFGSRTDDAVRGGDIDLCVEATAPMSADDWVRRRGAFVARLYRGIGERRIDVVPAGVPGLSAPDELVAAARRHGIELVRT